jgi:hypothetical protein
VLVDYLGLDNIIYSAPSSGADNPTIDIDYLMYHNTKTGDVYKTLMINMFNQWAIQSTAPVAYWSANDTGFINPGKKDRLGNVTFQRTSVGIYVFTWDATIFNTIDYMVNVDTEEEGLGSNNDIITYIPQKEPQGFTIYINDDKGTPQDALCNFTIYDEN